MIIDALGLLSDAQALTTTGYSTNTIDLGSESPVSDIGNGEEMEVVITVDVAADTADADETYQFNFVESANADLTSDTDLVEMVVPRATLVAGYKVHLPVPKGIISARYVGVEYVLGGTTPTITCTAALQPASMSQEEAVYSIGYTVS